MPRIKIIRGHEQQARIQAELAHARAWRRWELGRSRCPYCIDVADPYDWLAMCDCWYDEDLKLELEANLRRRPPRGPTLDATTPALKRLYSHEPD